MAPNVGLKDEFVNSTKGFIGVVTVDPNGKEKAIAVRPGQSVWLTEDEQILTANAPRNDEDNPFTNGDLRLETRGADVKNRRPIGNQQPDAPPPADEPEQGGQEEEPPAANGDGPTVVDLSQAEEKDDTSEAKAPRKSRAKADKERQEAEKEREAQARKQGEAGAVPVEETGAAVSAKGVPEMGKRAAGEEVATPDAPAAEKS